MLRLGLKLTHDGGFAILDNDRLICSHEAEKSRNLPRHSALAALDLPATLGEYGYELGDFDRVVVDGWIDERVRIGDAQGERTVPVAPYHETPEVAAPLAPVGLSGPLLGAGTVHYVSYTHAAGHVLGTYATGPWAPAGQDALVLAWDGAMLPRLYHVDPRRGACVPLRQLFGFLGHVYPVFGSFFGPFRSAEDSEAHRDLPKERLLDLSGKVMAWVGLGTVDTRLFELLDEAQRRHAQLSYSSLFDFARAVARETATRGLPDENVVATFQAWLGQKLVEALDRLLQRRPELPRRLCFTGGCALNIAWNARLRACRLFEDVWVPPFPNDAGSALGAAATDLIAAGGGPTIDWDVYRGPALRDTAPRPEWSGAPCGLARLARFLHESDEPVVFLNGRAELGPRALGNRSILCSAARPETKALLNDCKQREWYRPVAPICLESEAPRVFDPGSRDPYMLFTHVVRAPWRERVPAIIHVDGTARLQTVSERQNPVVAQLLAEYRRLSGIPLLCNTSANLKGAGFFPDVASAMDWPAARYVWCEGTLYSRTGVPAAARG
ncbi:MAG: carbamoyltransferase N-terminal domain-containing protein [Solirubrobacteraceae bacterium]